VIAKGLSPGDRVVSDGQNQLKPGSKIQTRTEKPAPTGSAAAAPAPDAGAAP
jgi:hypothetical protein